MQDIFKKIIEFRDERNWEPFHNPKDLALSISIEASELLENFQWKNSDEAVHENLQNIKEELADVLIYAFTLAHQLDINVEQAILDKMKKNALKYPV